MKKVFGIIIILLLTVSNSSCWAEKEAENGGHKNRRIHPSSDLKYMGAFKLPKETSGHVLTFRADGDPQGTADGYPGSLFSSESLTSAGLVTEFTIPKPAVSPRKNVSDLRVAQVLQGPVDITGGKVNGNYSGLTLQGIQYLPAQSDQVGSRLYWARMDNYVNNPELSLGAATLDFPNIKVEGLWKLKGLNAVQHNNYIFEVPRKWADTYLRGKYLVCGRFRDGRGNHCGPGLFAYAPWQHGNPPSDGQALDSIRLLHYEIGQGEMNNYSVTDIWRDGAWLEAGDKAAVIFTGSKSQYYGYYGGALPDDGGTSGYHSTPNQAAILFYDPNDFAEVVLGRQRPHDPQPYAVMQLENYLFSQKNLGSRTLGGVGYDRENNILYIGEPKNYSGDSNSELVHVFRIVNDNEPEDTIPPSPPEHLLGHRTQNAIELSWDASNDEHKNVVYVVYRKGVPMGMSSVEYFGHKVYAEDFYHPIGITTETFYHDEKYMYFVAPYRYKVEARDVVNNVASKEIVLDEGEYLIIDSSNFVYKEGKSIKYWLPEIVVGKRFEHKLEAAGGIEPYSWNVSFLIPGLSLDKKTGLISGVPEIQDGIKPNRLYYTHITVKDSAEPVPNLASVYNLLIMLKSE